MNRTSHVFAIPGKRELPGHNAARGIVVRQRPVVAVNEIHDKSPPHSPADLPRGRQILPAHLFGWYREW
jgi:hypothetical protein